MTKFELPPEDAFLVDFAIQNVPTALGLPVSDLAAAAIFDLSEEGIRAHEQAAERIVERTATELLKQPQMAAAIDRLPVPGQGKILALGDSITIYNQSYARLMAAMIAQRRPDDNIQFLNGAQSGFTSANGWEYVHTLWLDEQPDLAFISYGVNDCKHFGGPDSKTLVSLEEYRANVEAIISILQKRSQARLVLLTPTPVLENVVTVNEDFEVKEMAWYNKDLAAFAGAVRELAAEHRLTLVDLMAEFTSESDPSLYLEDGLHPGLAGQLLILKLVLDAVTG